MKNGLNGQNGLADGRGKAMASAAAGRVYGQHSGYRNLKAYQVAELVYDFTCRFCARYIPKSDRHHDQMVQAARSGFQNIAEGSEDSATSKKLEMNLTNVARSSLDECRKDYIKYLDRRGLRHWQEGEAVFAEARQLRPKTLEEAVAWVNRPGATEPTEERAANLGAVLATQAHWLTERLLDRQARDFETGGGFAERLYRARTGHPKPAVVSVPSVSQTPLKRSEPPA
jgi:four helix bundle suffix protein